MDRTCSLCNEQTPYLQSAQVKTLVFNNNEPAIKPLEQPICKRCEQELKEYKSSWEVLSH